MTKSCSVVLATYGSLGDLYPYLALAQELRARGHRPVLTSSASHRETVESAGIDFRAVRPDPVTTEDPQWVHRATHRASGTEYIIRKLILPFLEESYHDTAPLVERADLVVAHPVNYAAKLAAEVHGVPWALGALQPVIFFSTHDPPLLPRPRGADAFRFLGPRFYSVLYGMVRLVSRGWAAPLREMRRELGLPERVVDPFMGGQFSETLNLALFSPLLGPHQPDWPPNAVVTGFPFFEPACSNGGPDRATAEEGGNRPIRERIVGDRTSGPAGLNHVRFPRIAGLSPELTRFLDAGSPPIVFTLGSFIVYNAGRFFAESAEAAHRLGRRAVLLVGSGSPDRPLGSAGDLFVADFASHRELFPRAAAIVHHGGIGTTAEALRAGRPMLVVPFSHDQPDNARRVERLGVARVVGRSAYRVARVTAELANLLEDPRYETAAARVAAQIARERGAEAACDAIEACLDALEPPSSLPASDTVPER